MCKIPCVFLYRYFKFEALTAVKLIQPLATNLNFIRPLYLIIHSNEFIKLRVTRFDIYIQLFPVADIKCFQGFSQQIYQSFSFVVHNLVPFLA